jgi:ketosteroid isomerase-like protein
MKSIGQILLVVLLTWTPVFALDPPAGVPRPKVGPSLSPVMPQGAPSATPATPADSGIKFVAVDIQGVKVWLGGGDLDLKEYRGSKFITFKLINKLDTDHGFAVDPLKIRQVVKPGEELTLTVPLEDIEPSLSVYHYYCHLHPGHLGGTGVVTGRVGFSNKNDSSRSKDQVPARSTEEATKPDFALLKGRLIKIERGFYVIESAPSKEIRVSAPLDTAVDENGRAFVGEWIEAQISSDLHVIAIKKAPPTYTIEGDLIKMEGDTYIVADSPGNPVTLKLNKDTKADGTAKVGDRIRTEFAPDGRAISIRKSFMTPAEPSGGGSSDRSLHAAQEVLKVDRDFASALVRRDATALERALAEDATVVIWKSDVLNKTQYLGDITSGDLVFKSLDIESAKARLYGDAALVTGRYAVKARYKEQDVVGQQRYTNLYVRQQGVWRLLSQDMRAFSSSQP